MFLGIVASSVQMKMHFYISVKSQNLAKIGEKEKLNVKIVAKIKTFFKSIIEFSFQYTGKIYNKFLQSLRQSAVTGRQILNSNSFLKNRKKSKQSKNIIRRSEFIKKTIQKISWHNPFKHNLL